MKVWKLAIRKVNAYDEFEWHVIYESNKLGVMRKGLKYIRAHNGYMSFSRDGVMHFNTRDVKMDAYPVLC